MKVCQSHDVVYQGLDSIGFGLQSQLEAEDIARSGLLECFDMAKYAMHYCAICYPELHVHA